MAYLDAGQELGPDPSCVGIQSKVESGRIDLKKIKQLLGQSMLTELHAVSQGGGPGNGSVWDLEE